MTRHLFASLVAGAIAVVALSSTPTRVLAFEYVSNGGFEHGTEPWNSFGGVLTSVSDGTAFAGSRVGRLAIADGSSGATAQQLVASPAPVGAYHLVVRVRVAFGGPPVTARLQLRAGSAQQQVIVPLDSTAWQAPTVDLNVLEPADLLVLITVTGSSGDAIDIDDAELSGVDPNSITPSPTSTGVASSPTGLATFTRTPTPTRSTTPTKTPTPTPDNYVGDLRNGSFESTQPDGSLVAWDHYGGSLSTASSPARGGDRSARLESSTDSTKWLYQRVAVHPGETYAFAAWIYDDDPAVASTFLRISWYASTDASGSAISSADSITRLHTADAAFRFLTTASVPAPFDAHSARVRVMLAPMSTERATIYVDDATFGPAIPKPATATAAAAISPRDDGTTDEVLGASSRRGNGATFARGPAVFRISGSRVVINEVFYDSAASGADAENEWVELYNAGDVDQDVAGWTLEDNASSDPLPPLVVPAGGFAIVAASDSFADGYPDYHGARAVIGGRIGNSLGNDGDRLSLKDPAGAVVDAVSWGKDATVLDPPIADVPAGHSIERRTPGADSDSAADFTDNINPSPGGPFTPAEPLSADAHRQQGATSGEVPILAGNDGSFHTALIWLILGSTSTLVAVVGAWRLLPIVRQRLAR